MIEILYTILYIIIGFVVFGVGIYYFNTKPDGYNDPPAFLYVLCWPIYVVGLCCKLFANSSDKFKETILDLKSRNDY